MFGSMDKEIKIILGSKRCSSGRMCFIFSLESGLDSTCAVNVLKFQTLFSFCSQIKCWLLELEVTKWLSE